MQNNWITRSAQILGDDTAVGTLAEQWRGVQREHAAGVREHQAMRKAGTPAEEAKRVVEHLENGRATWAITHVHSAVDANFAAVSFPDEAARAAAVKTVTEHVLGAPVHLPAAELPPAPEALRRRDREFTLTNHATTLHPPSRIIPAPKFIPH